MHFRHRRAAVALACAAALIATTARGYAASVDPDPVSPESAASGTRAPMDLYYGFVRASVVYTKGNRQYQTGVVGNIFTFCTPDHDTDEIAESAKWRIISDVRSRTGASKVTIAYGPWITQRTKRASAVRERQSALQRGSMPVGHSFTAYARPGSCRSR